MAVFISACLLDIRRLSRGRPMCNPWEKGFKWEVGIDINWRRPEGLVWSGQTEEETCIQLSKHAVKSRFNY